MLFCSITIDNVSKMSALSEASSTSCNEDNEDVDLNQDAIEEHDNSIQHRKEDNEDVDVDQEDTEDSEDVIPAKMRLGVAVKSLRRMSNEIKKEFCAEKKRDFQNIPRQDTTIDFRKGIDLVKINNIFHTGGYFFFTLYQPCPQCSL